MVASAKFVFAVYKRRKIGISRHFPCLPKGYRRVGAEMKDFPETLRG
jgi:hypothetical protein